MAEESKWKTDSVLLKSDLYVVRKDSQEVHDAKERWR